MGLVGKLTVVSLVVGVAYFWHKVTTVPPIPQLEQTWWGSGKPSKQDDTIRPFTIKISDEVLDDLAERLEVHGKLTAPLEGANFKYGFNTDYLKTVVEFWQNDYKWRDREVFLNSLPQFKTRVSGLDMHFIHVKPKGVPAGTKVLPLLLLHGWPGSIREFYGLIPLLTTPRKGVDFVFEVIAPSLPGYGFSEGAANPGLGAAQAAVVMKSLMERVGHTTFYVQGGDWGSAIGTNLAIFYPENVLGFHSNFCLSNGIVSMLKTFVGSFWPSLVVDKEYAPRLYPYTKRLFTFLEEFGYMHIQATKPDTIGVALSDSPVGLAAYLLEKFSTWTNPEWTSLADGGLLKKFTITDLLDNVMIYWITGSITTSMRLYSETLNKAQFALNLEHIPCQVPSACAVFPHELAYQSESIVKDKYTNLVRFTHMDRGGHFAAFEEPQLLADDIWAAVKTIDSQTKYTTTTNKT